MQVNMFRDITVRKKLFVDDTSVPDAHWKKDSVNTNIWYETKIFT